MAEGRSARTRCRHATRGIVGVQWNQRRCPRPKPQRTIGRHRGAPSTAGLDVLVDVD